MSILLPLIIAVVCFYVVRRLMAARQDPDMKEGDRTASGCATGCLGFTGAIAALFAIGFTWNLLQHGDTRGADGDDIDRGPSVMRQAVSTCSGQELGGVQHTDDYSRVTTVSVEAAQCLAIELGAPADEREAMYSDVASGDRGSDRWGGYSVSWSGSGNDFEARFAN